ncbi:actin interacting protein 3, partial [Cytidiella melzeri]
MRQLYVDFMSQTKESLGALRTQTQNVRQLATAEVGASRAYIIDGKSKLDTRSQTILTKMEELQDTVEAIKEDVLKRNISPRPQVHKSIVADFDFVDSELDKLEDSIQTVKPTWKITWEKELQDIVEEQQFLSHQEEFLVDLREDLKASREVYGRVEKVISLRGTG